MYEGVRILQSASSFPLAHCRLPSHRWESGTQVSEVYGFCQSLQLNEFFGQPEKRNSVLKIAEHKNFTLRVSKTGSSFHG